MMAQSYACPIGPYGEKGYQHERRTKNVPHDGGTAPALSRTPVCRESAPGD